MKHLGSIGSSALLLLASMVLCPRPMTAQDDEHGGKEVKVSIDKVPAKVKAAIQKEVAKDKLVDIGEITKADGKKVWEIELWKGGDEYDVLFDADGKVLMREKQKDEDDDGDEEKDEKHAKRMPKVEKVAIDKVPATVKASVLKEAGEASYGLDKVSLPNGKAVYVASIKGKGTVQLSEAGMVLMRANPAQEDEEVSEKEVSIDKVPAKVKAAILAEVGKDKLCEIEEIMLKSGKKVWEIEIKKGDACVEVTFDADGKVLGREKEEHDDDGDDDDKDDEKKEGGHGDHGGHEGHEGKDRD
ncbi:MAG: PepSY-like domain-containing protein [Planctomycetota bacterium]